MARSRSLAVAGINVSVSPHPRGQYRQLLLAALGLVRPIHIQGDQYLLLQEIDTSHSSRIQGMIARFTRIDPNARWFNVKDLKPADKDDVSKVQIPANLQPNYRSYFFEFIEKGHTFVFESYGVDGSLSPRSVQKFLDGLLNSEGLTKEFGNVAVTVIQDRRQLDYIWSFKQLRRLEIRIKQPNPDFPAGLDARLARRLQRFSAKEMVEEFTNKPGTSLKPDREAKQMAAVAITNGSVSADGTDEHNVSVQVSTANFPKTERVRYDPDQVAPKTAFERATEQFMSPPSDDD